MKAAEEEKKRILARSTSLKTFLRDRNDEIVRLRDFRKIRVTVTQEFTFATEKRAAIKDLNKATNMMQALHVSGSNNRLNPRDRVAAGHSDLATI